MKTYTTILTLILIVNLVTGQPIGKTISIKDKHSSGVGLLDTSVLGYNNGDVYVYKILSLNHGMKQYKKDTLNAFQIHFVRPFEGKLRNYNMNLISDEDFSKANYIWITDSIVSVTLRNDANNKSRNIKLVQMDCKKCTAGVFQDDSIEIIPINDKRKLSIAKFDTATTGWQSGDVYVNRVYESMSKLYGSKSEKTPNDTINAYEIHFLRPYESKLKNYQLGYIGKDDFNYATYTWQTDSIVTVTLQNDATNKKKKLKLAQTNDKGHSAAIFEESLNGDGEK